MNLINEFAHLRKRLKYMGFKTEITKVQDVGGLLVSNDADYFFVEPHGLRFAESFSIYALRYGEPSGLYFGECYHKEIGNPQEFFEEVEAQKNSE